jgi:DNA polymerase I
VRRAFAGLGVELPDTRNETLIERRDEHPLVHRFIEWRKAETEVEAFGTEWLTHLRPDGRVHPDWRLLGARTGRMSCSRPGLQQLKRGAVRDGIVAAGGRLLVRADFSQIEARVAARIAPDETLARLFMERQDIHRYTAGRILGKPAAAVTGEERQLGKALVFGLLFGMSAESLRTHARTNYGVRLSPDEAEEFRSRFFELFPGLAAWHERARRECHSRTEHRSLLGRRRLTLPAGEGDRDSNAPADICEPADINRLGVTLNHPVQGTAADLFKASVRQVWERGAEMPWADLVMLVHDEIMLEVDEGRADETSDWLRSIMVDTGNTILHPVPVEVRITVGRTWGG